MPTTELIEFVQCEVSPLWESLDAALAALITVGPETPEVRDVMLAARQLTSRLVHWRRRGVPWSAVAANTDRLATMVEDGQCLAVWLSRLNKWTLRQGSALMELRAALTSLVWEMQKQTANAEA